MAGKLEKVMTFLSVIATLYQAGVGIIPAVVKIEPSTQANTFLNLLVYIFGSFSSYLHSSPSIVKVFVFFVSEAANAYVFAELFNWLHRRGTKKILHLFLMILVIVSTCCISVLFLRFLVFDDGPQPPQYFLLPFLKLLLFIIGAVVSLIITLVLFCWEHLEDKAQNEPGSLEEIFGKISNLAKMFSIPVLMLFYVVICLAVLIFIPFDSN